LFRSIHTFLTYKSTLARVYFDVTDVDLHVRHVEIYVADVV
jgi:hypothetical protein